MMHKFRVSRYGYGNLIMYYLSVMSAPSARKCKAYVPVIFKKHNNFSSYYAILYSHYNLYDFMKAGQYLHTHTPHIIQDESLSMPTFIF